MTLAIPLPGATMTQAFGPSPLAIQPSMYLSLDELKAYWANFPGSKFHVDVHAGADWAGFKAGTPLLAAENGHVTRSSYDGINGGGNVVEVQIRPNVRYSYNHCQSRMVAVGDDVVKGQPIATVGATGTIQLPDGTKVRSTYGVHCHEVVTIYEVIDGVGRTMLYDPQAFMQGGALANDPRVTPAFKERLVKIKHPVNIRTSPALVPDNIAYVSRDTGIYTINGVLVGKYGTNFLLTDEFENVYGGWGQMTGFKRTLYVMQGLYY